MALRVRLERRKRANGESIVSAENAVARVYERQEEAESVVGRLQSAGFDMRKVSVVGKEDLGSRQVFGYYREGGRIKYWGRSEKFWGPLWETLDGWAFFSVPGIGPVLVAGPLAGWMVATLSNAVIFGGLTALGTGLYSIGISQDEVLLCEGALREGRYLVLAHGSASAVRTAKEILGVWKAPRADDWHAGGSACATHLESSERRPLRGEALAAVAGESSRRSASSARLLP
jgi:hypothetical protein